MERTVAGSFLRVPDPDGTVIRSRGDVSVRVMEKALVRADDGQREGDDHVESDGTPHLDSVAVHPLGSGILLGAEEEDEVLPVHGKVAQRPQTGGDLLVLEHNLRSLPSEVHHGDGRGLVPHFGSAHGEPRLGAADAILQVVFVRISCGVGRVVDAPPGVDFQLSTS